MRAYNTQIKTRHQLTLRDFKGVDYSSSPMRVAPNRATEMSNFIYEDGVNQKRHGWEEKLRFLRDDGYHTKMIEGLYKVPNTNILIVCADTEIYKVVAENDKYTKKLLGSYGIHSKVEFFYNGENVYILGSGKYLRYNKNDDSIVNMIDTDFGYIPTTTINIRESQSATGVDRETLDAVNLLTRKRINTLVGVDATTGTWRLDGQPIILNNGDVKIKIYTAENSLINAINVGNEIKEVTGQTALGQVLGNTIGNIMGDLVKFTINTKPAIDNDANIRVEYKANISDVNYHNIIATMQIGVIFGTNGNSNRLFLGNMKNKLYYSEVDNFEYFPDNNYISVGNNGSEVTGFLRLQDNLLAVFKNGDNNDANVFYVSGEDIVKYDDAGNPISVRTAFPVVGSVLGETPLNNDCCINFGNEHLILSKNGLFAIQLTQNLTTSERNTYSRSYSINKVLTKARLYDTKLNVIGDKLYMSTYSEEYGFKTFVCDQRYRYTHPDDGSLQYEWWVWDNVRFDAMYTINGKLCFYRFGNLYEFTDSYLDISLQETRQGDLMLNGTNKISYNSLITGAFKDGGVLYFKGMNAITPILQNAVIERDHGFHHDWDSIAIRDMAIRPYEDDKVTVTNVGESGLIEGGVYDVLYNGAVHIALSIDGENPVSINAGGFDINLVLSEERKLIIGNVVADYTIPEYSFQVFDKSDLTRPLVVGKTSAEVIPLAIIGNPKPVVAKWYTAVMDMGNNAVSKTLTKMTISTDKDVNSKVAFGYETRKIIGMINARGTGKFSFDDLDFEDFTFETGFTSAYSQLVNVRNFNYIIFRYISSNDRNCTINDITLEYKYNKKNRGVN